MAHIIRWGNEGVQGGVDRSPSTNNLASALLTVPAYNHAISFLLAACLLALALLLLPELFQTEPSLASVMFGQPPRSTVRALMLLAARPGHRHLWLPHGADLLALRRVNDQHVRRCAGDPSSHRPVVLRFIVVSLGEARFGKGFARCLSC